MLERTRILVKACPPYRRDPDPHSAEMLERLARWVSKQDLSEDLAGAVEMSTLGHGEAGVDRLSAIDHEIVGLLDIHRGLITARFIARTTPSPTNRRLPLRSAL